MTNAGYMRASELKRDENLPKTAHIFLKLYRMQCIKT